MVNIRQAAVAGTFYPADPERLKLMLQHYLIDAPQGEKVPKALIVPHAGYIYSGAIAATAYVRLKAVRKLIKRVLLIGPSHRVGFQGLALSTADQFSTPLGDIAIEKDDVKQIAGFPFVHYLDQAHELEHSLEVHLPFLQTVLDDFCLIPVVAGDASAEQVCQVIEMFWGQADTLIVISSDLSHFHDYQTAKKLDQKTSEIIQQLQYEKLGGSSACGYVPVSGLMALARKNKLQIKTIDLRSSGDTAGREDMNRVVGYGAYVIE
ncbi:MAG: AmmeMemoRadiSam system protein B [Methylococcaceae bacterium]|nr:AmmeMemoRadiSam system protein B [Methylococcaceae bacterium]